MKKRASAEIIPQWTVEMRVERHISVTVEATSEDEAIAKAERFDIVGDEMDGDTLSCRILRATRDE